ncbi:hypothetical protein [Empedobacter falsenii]|uniref:Bacteriocin n=1 Tax=Empedobacter falsenii TaxID=343874 RepID=A0AAW7DJ35_9FLAO|nr:hypothetical protein [Empedobacter falsenii]MDM1551673.1 hypothetical protein [Empedobacter falsenii]
MKNLKKFQISKNKQKNVKGGNIRPPKDGQCQAGWYLCPTNICVYDNGGDDPIVPGSPHYNACFG